MVAVVAATLVVYILALVVALGYGEAGDKDDVGVAVVVLEVGKVAGGARDGTRKRPALTLRVVFVFVFVALVVVLFA